MNSRRVLERMIANGIKEVRHAEVGLERRFRKLRWEEREGLVTFLDSLTALERRAEEVEQYLTILERYAPDGPAAA